MENRNLTARYQLSETAQKRRRIVRLIEDCIFAAVFFGIYILTGFLLMVLGV